MGKGKPRHNPNKRANKRGGWCSHCEECSGVLRCMYEGTRAIAICKGNPHNCIKVDLRKFARLSNAQRNNGYIPIGVSLNEEGTLYNPM